MSCLEGEIMSEPVENTKTKTIQSMDPGAAWYSEDSQGHIVILEAYWKAKNRNLPLLARMALALTDLCSQRGLGRVRFPTAAS
jgi:hypothetical protein